jgi:hypothetical protein
MSEQKSLPFMRQISMRLWEQVPLEYKQQVVALYAQLTARAVRDCTSPRFSQGGESSGSTGNTPQD